LHSPAGDDVGPKKVVDVVGFGEGAGVGFDVVDGVGFGEGAGVGFEVVAGVEFAEGAGVGFGVSQKEQPPHK